MRYCLLVVLCFYCVLTASGSTILPAINSTASAIPVIQQKTTRQNSCSSLFAPTPRQVYRLTGEKLSLKEKIALKLFQHKLKKAALKRTEKRQRDKGKTAYILGLIALFGLLVPGLGLLSLPLAILAIVTGNKAKKEDPGNRNARRGVTLGIATIGIIVIVVGIVLLVVALPVP